ncbi:ABC transporter ATP-binding protein/permease [Candidatus Actinomarina sp.]|nr:ABC transporter ATP-binding protein/permease [Candidatus Actinomarina sp.]
MFNSYKEIISKIFYVSRISKTTNKKLATIIVVLLANVSAFLDILIIISIAINFSDNISQNNFILNYLDIYQSNKFLLIVIVVLRFLTLLFQKIYTKKIELIVDNDIKNHLVSEVFEKNNFSISDSLFFVNILSQHISFFYSSFINFLVIFTQAIAYSVYLLLTNSVFLLYMLAILALGYFPIKLLFGLARNSMHESYTASKDANNYIQNIIENMFLIKLYDKGEDEITKINKSLSQRRNFLFKNEIYGSLTAVLPSFIIFLIFSIVALSSRLLALITIDFLGIVLRLFQSISSMANVFSRIINSYVHIEELESIDKNKQILNTSNFITKLEDNSNNILVLDNVSFRYFNSSFKTFNKISLKIEKGKHYVVSGPNGAGKSTLLALFAGILIPSEGTVTTTTNKVGYVGPNPLIIDGSLKDNILFGSGKNISDQELYTSIKEIKLFENEKEIDLDMSINNKNLSSGQMQKISFLRVFNADLDLLLLDESTSNLDINAKKNVVRKIQSLNGLTIINSTHEPELFNFYDKKINIDLIQDERKITIDLA